MIFKNWPIKANKLQSKIANLAKDIRFPKVDETKLSSAYLAMLDQLTEMRY
jgi:hypothetical protein